MCDFKISTERIGLTRIHPDKTILCKEHERLIRSTQRKMLRLSVQTKREHKQKTKNIKEEKDTMSDEEPMNKTHKEECKESPQNSEEEIEEGNSSNKDCDQDSEVSIMNKTDKENRYSRK